MDRGAWQATVHGVPKILTQLRDWVPLRLSCQGRGRRGRLVFNSSVSTEEMVALSSKTRSGSSSKPLAVSPWTTLLPMAHEPFSSCSDESSNSNSSRKSDNHSPAVVTTTVTSKKQPSVLVTFPKEERKSVSGKTSIK